MTGQPNEPLLDCRDGHKAELLESNTGVTSIYLEKLVQGEAIVEPELAAASPAEDWRRKARVRRDYFLYQALCRFLNAGGKLADIENITCNVIKFAETSPVLELPPDWDLVDVLEGDGRRQVVLGHGDDITVIEEDSWIDTMPLTHLAGRLPGTPLEPYHDDHPRL